jgi:hypothetical protein
VKKKICAAIYGLIISICLSSYATGFDDKITHPAITEQAISNKNKFDFNSYLQNKLGFTKGILTKLPSNSPLGIIDIIKQGSTDEDKEACRRANHMHDPLKAWNISYMTDEPWGDATTEIGCAKLGPYDKKYSNITWATGQYSKDGPVESRVGQAMGWDNARYYYYKALTSTTNLPPPGRDAYFAYTFQALGQVLHLLQDMAVPAHTRNDFLSHLKSEGGLLYMALMSPYQPFERYVKRTLDKDTSLVSNAPVFPSFTNTRPTDYWDTNTYINGANPSESLSIGLAEFSNPNYFSDSTIPNNKPDDKHKFPYPKIESANYHICEDYATGPTKEKRKYVSRNSRGGCDHFATVNVWTPLLYNQTNEQLTAKIATLNLHLDENVHKTYANELLPRAVGYSAGLLDYFFRGTIDITVPSNGIYSMIDATQSGFNPAFTAIKLKATNTTTTGESMTNGTIQLVVKYKVAHADPFQPGLIETDADFSYIVVPEKNNVNALYSATPTELNFDLSQNPIPLWATDVYLQVVFKGTLGTEADAVAVGFKDISEPTPIDIFNNMDKVCLYSSWYNAGSPEAIEQVDTNHNGIADRNEADAYAYDLKNIYLRFSPYNPNPPYYFASPSAHDFTAPDLAAGDSLRAVYILSDYMFNLGHYMTWVATDTADPWSYYDFNRLWWFSAVKRQADYSEDIGLCGGSPACYIDVYPKHSDVYPAELFQGFFTFRNVSMWWGSVKVLINHTYPADSECSYDLL